MSSNHNDNTFDEQLKEIRKQRTSQIPTRLSMSTTPGDDTQYSYNTLGTEYTNVIEHYSDDEHSTYSSSITAPKDVYDDISNMESTDVFEHKTQDSYHSRGKKRILSPERSDPLSQSSVDRGYSIIIQEHELQKEEATIMRKISNIQQSHPEPPTRKKRWDEEPSKPSEWEQEPKKRTRWDMTPISDNKTTPILSSWEQTPSRSRWDETPTSISASNLTIRGESAIGSSTPIAITPYHITLQQQHIRNKPWTDHDLDTILPSEGFAILPQPDSYIPIRTPSRKLTSTPAHSASLLLTPVIKGAALENAVMLEAAGEQATLMKPEDYQYFGKLLENTSDDMDIEQAKERRLMTLLLRIKNGTPSMRKASLRQITERARDFGANLLFDKILPLLMSPSLEDQERHLLVKVIDRILFKLEDLIRPYVHKILVVIEPLLIDENYYTRVEGREIISNLSKAAGLASMIAAMRPDIDHSDEYVRNTTARAFSVVASALGISTLLPFIKAVCSSKKNWTARHTGIKIVQQIAILMGCAVLPYLKQLVECIQEGLADEQQKVKTMTALSISALAEASSPYGIEAFDTILKPLWQGVKLHRGKPLAAFLKAIGYITPLMDAEYANYYTREVVPILVREFQSPDEEMKKIVLKVVKQCISADGITAEYIRDNMLSEFFKNFWVRRMALDKRNYKQLVDTTTCLAGKVGVSQVVDKIVNDLKDESEPYRKMVLEAIHMIIQTLGAADINSRLEEQLVDGILYLFQEQTTEDSLVLEGLGIIIQGLGTRIKPYLAQICSTILWRLNNKNARVRQQAADLVGKIASVMVMCHEEKLLGHLGLCLYEYLGEEYPEVLGSILGGLKAIVYVIGMSKMNPPVKELLPRLTPILRNRHEKVQENCIDLIGRIADRSSEAVSAREWMRICFELLDVLKAHRKAIRRAAVSAFGYISKAIGPQDVLSTLLNNLKVQERQNRVCTTVAIAIVAETCSPFTVLPALMNEYRVPELNVQNGVLKSIAFMFEYIGEMGKDYIYAILPLLEDALIERDLVHRQTACTAVKHAALGVFGLNCEDALIHLLNYVWPNIFEQAPHMITAFMDAMDGLRVALGADIMLKLVLQGLFHPARRVREIYWKIYNNVYMGHQDALVAYYPFIELDSKYVRNELELLL